MDPSVYGITPELTLTFLIIGTCIGLIWQSIHNSQIYNESSTNGKIIVFIALLFILIFGSYLLLGYVLTSFIYSIVGIGIITEFICMRIGEAALLLVDKLKHKAQQKVINSSNAMLHTLIEELRS